MSLEDNDLTKNTCFSSRRSRARRDPTFKYFYTDHQRSLWPSTVAPGHTKHGNHPRGHVEEPAGPGGAKNFCRAAPWGAIATYGRRASWRKSHLSAASGCSVASSEARSSSRLPPCVCCWFVGSILGHSPPDCGRQRPQSDCPAPPPPPPKSTQAGKRRAVRSLCCVVRGQELVPLAALCLLLVRRLDPWPLPARLRPSEAEIRLPSTHNQHPQRQRNRHERSRQVVLRPGEAAASAKITCLQ